MDNSTSYIELHFITEDGSHSMNAEALNKCIYEYLGIIKEISSKFKIEVEVEAEALEQGGIRQWLKLHAPSKDDIIKAFFLYALVEIPTSPITVSIEHFVEKSIDFVFTPERIRKLQEECTAAELEYKIAWYKNETQKITESINTNVIAKRTSNFYTSAQECNKVNEISFTYTNDNLEPLYCESVKRHEFGKLILATDDLEPLEVSDGVIEIVSPVLKKGKYKWSGIYNGEVIQFSVKSNEFKTLVQTGEVSFRNGTSIRCLLRINRKLDAEGNVKNTSYEVPEIYSTFDNDNPVETPTPEGKRKKQQMDAERRQLNLDFGEIN